MMTEMDCLGGGGGGDAVVEYGYRTSNLSNYSTTTHKVTTGFKPKKILITYAYNGSQVWRMQDIYDADVSDNTYTSISATAAGTVQPTPSTVNLPAPSEGYGIKSIADDGFYIGSQLDASAYNIAYMVFG